MDSHRELLRQIHQAAACKVLFLPHAVRQMARPERMISPAEVRSVISNGEVIEEYPEDPRGHSCLLLGHGTDSRPLHVVCAPRTEYVAIITAYIPRSDQWEADWRTRKAS
ncbi:MAG: DUF4258 domain-containing protein [Candidatus Tectimicrobiota bacterium]